MDQKLLQLLGNFPRRAASLDVEIVREEETEGHMRQLITYKVEEQERIPAYLLWPKSDKLKRNGKYPAILALHQHAGEFFWGKSEAAGALRRRKTHAMYGKELADRGYVVIVPDQLAFEERRPLEWEAHDNGCIDGKGYERYVYFRALLNGSTLQAKYLSDMQCALELLCGLDKVDAERVGTIGHSMGGQEAIWLMMYDERVRAGASSCGISTYRQIQENKIIHNFAFYVPNLLLHGDMDQFMTAIVPRALFISTGIEDGIFPIRGVRAIDQSLREAYHKIGAPQRYRYVELEGGHSFPEETRNEVYDWFDKQL